MRILTRAYLDGMNPCSDRKAFYIENCNDFEGTAIDLLNLEVMPADDKMWICLRQEVMRVEAIQEFCIRCAEEVLPIFEASYLEDTKPRELLDAAKALVRSGVDNGFSPFIDSYAAEASTSKPEHAGDSSIYTAKASRADRSTIRQYARGVSSSYAISANVDNRVAILKAVINDLGPEYVLDENY